MSWLILLGVACLVIIADQVCKSVVVAHIAPGQAVEVMPGFFDLVNIRNRGAAFGFLNRHDIEWQFWLFLLATALAIGAICVLARQSRGQKLMLCGLGLILGGALGNLIDRLRDRAVVDFLDFYWHSWHWPAFNVADAAICVGVCMAGLASMRPGRQLK